MHICSECNQELEDSCFDYRGGTRKGLQSTCKPCSLARLQQHRQEMREYLNQKKLSSGCSICGYNKCAFALHFDHINPLTKDNKGNSRAVEVSWSKERIDKELTKCVILCANCHAEKTFQKQDYLVSKE